MWFKIILEFQKNDFSYVFLGMQVYVLVGACMRFVRESCSHSGAEATEVGHY